jgi:hypothetical protein
MGVFRKGIHPVVYIYLAGKLQRSGALQTVLKAVAQRGIFPLKTGKKPSLPEAPEKPVWRVLVGKWLTQPLSLR